MSVRMTVITGFGPEACIMLILHMCKEKWLKTAVNAFQLLKFPIAIGNYVAESNSVVRIVARSSEGGVSEHAP